MVLLNGNPVQFSNFPDGTLKVDVPIEDMCVETYQEIEWRYENDAEFMLVAFLKMHLSDDPATNKAYHILKLGYIPNSRMDRQKADTEVFTLKHFAKLINSLGFDEVDVIDPHSHVSEALINHIYVEPADEYIEEALGEIYEETNIKLNDIVLFFPDEGAQKRYQTEHLTDFVSFFGNKVRDWKSGNILGFNIETHTDKELSYLKDKTVLIIDDIISAGGTVYHSVKELEKYGVSAVYAYCTHLENTIFKDSENKLRKLLEDDGSIFKRIYTTNTIYNQTHDKVKTIDVI